MTKPKLNYTVGFIGGGNMAASIIGGLIPSVLSRQQVCVFDPSQEKLDELHATYGIATCSSNEELIEKSDVVVFAVKPQVFSAVVKPIQQQINQKKPLLISIAAGINCTSIEKWTDSTNAVIRVMPNTPALVKAGASGMFANANVSAEQKQISEQLIGSVGSASWLEKENDIDAVTALSGSGPAYFMLFVNSLITAGKKAGLSDSVAKQLAIDTCSGSAKLMNESDVAIEQLIKNVTSPGGTTEQALLSFEKNGLSSIVDGAFAAALNRSKELSKELG